MFNKNDYKAAFSKVTASEETYRRIMCMTKEKKTRKGGRTLSRIVLVAAIVSLLAVTASAAEYVGSWFTKYFSDHSEAALSTEQVAYIEENEQVLNESQTVDGWTVELKSAMNDERIAYIIVGIEAPQDVNLTPTVEDGCATSWFGAGNTIFPDGADLITNSEGPWLGSFSTYWEEDGDGLANTKNIMIQIEPYFEDGHKDPFASDVEWYIHIDNIVGKYENTEYHQELMNGKYQNQSNIMFTDEETEQLYSEVVLAEGTWDFNVTFNGGDREIELINEPVTVTACVGIKMDGTDVFGDTTITSFVLRSLSASIWIEDTSYAPDFPNGIYVVMKDGSRVQLNTSSGSPGEVEMLAETPIILDNVDYVLLGEGTKLPMPE